MRLYVHVFKMNAPSLCVLRHCEQNVDHFAVDSEFGEQACEFFIGTMIIILNLIIKVK